MAYQDHFTAFATEDQSTIDTVTDRTRRTVGTFTDITLPNTEMRRNTIEDGYGNEALGPTLGFTVANRTMSMTAQQWFPEAYSRIAEYVATDGSRETWEMFGEFATDRQIAGESNPASTQVKITVAADIYLDGDTFAVGSSPSNTVNLYLYSLKIEQADQIATATAVPTATSIIDFNWDTNGFFVRRGSTMVDLFAARRRALNLPALTPPS